MTETFLFFFFPDKGWERLFKDARAGSTANETLTEDQWMIGNLKILKDFLREKSTLVLHSTHTHTHTHTHMLEQMMESKKRLFILDWEF